MKRTPPFSPAAKRNAALAGLAPLLLVAFAMFGYLRNQFNLSSCNSGKTLSCYDVYDSDQSRITNKKYLADRKRVQDQKDAEEARKVQEESRRQAAIAQQIKKETSQFQAEGWFQLQPGIYGRWCTQTCSTASVIGDASYWLLEVWAKDRPAGDIYARINILQNGVVVAWTNDTAYLSMGQRGVLTFSKHLPGSGGQYSAQITEFNARP